MTALSSSANATDLANKELSENAGLQERIAWAVAVLQLPERASRQHIEQQTRKLLKTWHQELHPKQSKTATAMTQRILKARAIITDYIDQYQYAFHAEEVDHYLSPQEWFHKRFGDEPVWSNTGKQRRS